MKNTWSGWTCGETCDLRLSAKTTALLAAEHEMASGIKELKVKAEHWMGMDHSRRYMLLDKTLPESTMHGGAKAVA